MFPFNFYGHLHNRRALAFWKANIPNQDKIAEREVTRCTNWPAQVLTYKIGAKSSHTTWSRATTA